MSSWGLEAATVLPGRPQEAPADHSRGTNLRPTCRVRTGLRGDSRPPQSPGYAGACELDVSAGAGYVPGTQAALLGVGLRGAPGRVRSASLTPRTEENSLFPFPQGVFTPRPGVLGAGIFLLPFLCRFTQNPEPSLGRLVLDKNYVAMTFLVLMEAV